MYEFRKADRWIQEELALTDSFCFAIFNPFSRRWEVRRWNGSYPQKLNSHNWIKDSGIILTVCEQDDETLLDIGYRPIDRRAVLAIAISTRNADNPKVVLHDIDESNRRLEESYDRELHCMAKDTAKGIYHHERELTVI